MSKRKTNQRAELWNDVLSVIQARGTDEVLKIWLGSDERKHGDEHSS